MPEACLWLQCALPAHLAAIWNSLYLHVLRESQQRKLIPPRNLLDRQRQQREWVVDPADGDMDSSHEYLHANQELLVHGRLAALSVLHDSIR